jgi:lysophospholipid acyltransferase (LPLAT)-like uncharacterized protein
MILQRLIARIAWVLILLWSKTITFRLLNGEVYYRMVEKRESAIYAFWHESLFFLLQAHHDTHLLIPVSESRDGEMITQVIKIFGFQVVRGSSKRKGDKALLAMVNRLRSGYVNVGITVDGPRGPRHTVKQGALFLAGVSKAPVIPVATVAKRAWTLKKSWDKHMLPFPFTEGLVVLGDPIFVDGTTEEEIESARIKLEAELERLTQMAQNHFIAAKETGIYSQQGERARVE